jgi:hypothetical protein
VSILYNRMSASSTSEGQMEVCNQLVHLGGGFLMEQLFGLGVANIFGSAFSAYPSTGINS